MTNEKSVRVHMTSIGKIALQNSGFSKISSNGSSFLLKRDIRKVLFRGKQDIEINWSRAFIFSWRRRSYEMGILKKYQ